MANITNATAAAKIAEQLTAKIQSFKPESTTEEIGVVREVGDGIASITGLKNAKSMEMLTFEDGSLGVALNLEQDRVGAMVLGDFTGIKTGQTVQGTGKILSLPVGEALLGRVVDPLGKPLDGKEAPKSKIDYPIEKIAPGVMTRHPVDTPLMTGIKCIDALIPIGRGQRELIIGDRQVGKTAIAVDTIINQAGKNVICIYVAIGQKESKVAKIVAKLKEAGAMEYTIVVLAGASDPASLQYIAPYAGCAIGEYFMDQGKDALVVYDDLSKHAWSYREISLLLRRPPGREAYPGDVFYLHSRLLERAVRLSKEYGGGSLTALPIIETQAGDVSAYIPTNVISITDGQIFLEGDLFYRGIRPALNAGLSVSRVGGDAQYKIMKKIAGPVRLDLAQFRELEAFAQFATDLDEATRQQIERGRRTVEILKQGQFQPMSLAHQIVSLYAVTKGLCDEVPTDKIQEWEHGIHEYMESEADKVLKTIETEKTMTPELEKSLTQAIKDWNKAYKQKT
jgi:F-type H+-transporting ATPase subunit alpha